MTAPPLAVTALSVGHGGRAVLSGIDLALAPGEILGLVGRNGAGKTSLLMTLLDLLPPIAGTVSIFGRPARETAARAPAFLLPDGFRPPAALTGRAMLDHLAALYRRRPDPTAEAVAMAALGYEPAWLKLPAGRWSKGMGQSFGLLAALSSGCRLLLLDEPLDGLDPAARAGARVALAGFAAGGGTVILSSHGLPDLDTLCHRIAVVGNGRLLALAPPAALPGRAPGEALEPAVLRLIAP